MLPNLRTIADAFLTDDWPRGIDVGLLADGLDGIAIVGAWDCIANTDGEGCTVAGLWQYSRETKRHKTRRASEDFDDWFAFPPQLSSRSAVVLDKSSYIRFLPNPNIVWDEAGTNFIRLRFKGWDGTGGASAGDRSVDAQNRVVAPFTSETVDLSITRLPCCDKSVLETNNDIAEDPIDLETLGCDFSALYTSPKRDTGGEVDECGVCGGNDADKDCAGICFGAAVVDSCGDCSGGTTGRAIDDAKDCAGNCDGAAKFDKCGVCSGGDTGVATNQQLDCANVCNGAAEVASLSADGCRAVCTATSDELLVPDCAGMCIGGAIEDGCGDCTGQSEKNAIFKKFNPMACLDGRTNGATASPLEAPASGGVTVTILGDGFVVNQWEYNSVRECRFMHTTTQADYKSPGTIIDRNRFECVAPTVADSGLYDIHITLDGSNYILIANDFNFLADGSTSRRPTARSDISFTDLSPGVIPVSAASIISLKGSGFNELKSSLKLLCMGISAGAAEKSIPAALGKATIVSDTELHCKFETPAASQQAKVYLSLSSTEYLDTGLEYVAYAHGPHMLAATLLPTGAGLTVDFDVPIVISASNEKCDEIWTSASRDLLASTSMPRGPLDCTVSDDKRSLTIIVHGGVTMRQGELLTMAGGVSQANADSSFATTTQYLQSAHQRFSLRATGAVEIQAPTAGFEAPTAQFRTPSHVQVCQFNKEIVLDGRWSTPLGGPPLIYEWGVRATRQDADISALVNFLREESGAGKDMIVVDTSTLSSVEDTDYIFELYVTSHYVAERSTLATQYVAMTKEQQPQVTFDGPSVRSIRSARDYTHVSVQIDSPCKTLPNGLTIRWNLQPPVAYSMPDGVTAFSIPAGVLNPGTDYQLVVQVWSNEAVTYPSVASLTMRTIANAPAPTILGGDVQGGRRLVSINSEVVLDASLTTDSLPLAGDPLDFTWQCMYGSAGTSTQKLPCLQTDSSGQAISFDLDNVESQGSKLTIPSGSAFPGIYIFTILARRNSAMTETSTAVEYVLSEVPRVSISGMFAGTEARITGNSIWDQAMTINAGDKLTILATAQSSSGNAVGSWSASEDVSVQQTSLLNLTTTATRSLDLREGVERTVPLVLPTNGFDPGTYRFRFTASGNQGDGYAEATVTVKAPPTVGILDEIPEQREETTEADGTVVYTPGYTDLSLSTSGWTAFGGAVPLRFQFGYRGSVESDGRSEQTFWLGPVTSSQYVTRWVPPSATSIIVVAVDADGSRSDPVVRDLKLRQSNVLLADVASHAQELVLHGKWEEATSKIASVLFGLNDQAAAELGAVVMGDSPAFRDDAAAIMLGLVQKGEIHLDSDNVGWIIDTLDVLVPKNDDVVIQKGARSAVANIMKTIVDLWLAPPPRFAHR